MLENTGNKLNDMFAAVEAADVARFRTCFEPDAVVWHNVDEQELGLDAVVELLNAVYSQTTARRYENRRSSTADDAIFVRHALCLTLHSGHVIRCPVMARIEISRNGLIARIDEYFDSRALDSMGQVAGLSSPVS